MSIGIGGIGIGQPGSGQSVGAVPGHSIGLPGVIAAGGELSRSTPPPNKVGFGFTAAATSQPTSLSMYEHICSLLL